jgi:hypothetical protein
VLISEFLGAIFEQVDERPVDVAEAEKAEIECPDSGVRD